MNPISTIFFGTEHFAATILEGLVKNPLFEVRLVITQPDRPVGRHQDVVAPPVKKIAEKHGIPFIQPSTLKEFTLEEKADIGIVAQYGLLIPEHILNAPTHGLINTHTSLLPKYRGATPIQSALIHGETETGVTIMKMDKGLDTGPILLQKELTIAPTDTYETLDVALAPLAIEGLTEAVPAYIAGTLKPIEQNNDEATLCREFTRGTGKIDWQKSAADIYNLYRGTTPWPGIWTTWENKRLKLLSIEPADVSLKPGMVETSKDALTIGTKSGSITVHTIQLEGKKAMDVKTFLTGFSRIHGTTLI
jgi:methionyl-tRNA formyltransferase